MAKTDNVHRIVMCIYKIVTILSHLSKLVWESRFTQAKNEQSEGIDINRVVLNEDVNRSADFSERPSSQKGLCPSGR